ncbi:MAG: GAF domain-containing protein [Rhizonema sp. PD38]|nr:GAF domain-containing protein [Rhizonema sp. PD38]
MTLITENDLRVRLEQENLLHRIINSVRRTLDLQDILTTTVAEVRSLLGTDRVMIYKFHADSSGQVIAESIHNNRLPSLLLLNFPADDIPPYARELFIKSRVRSVVDVDTLKIGYSPSLELENGELTSEQIHYRPLDSCHAEYLTAMGVKSSLIAPIINQDKLWGLLVSHHSDPRSVSEYEIEAVQMVVDQLSVAIAQSHLLTQAQERASRERIVNRIASLLHSLPTIELELALEEAVAAFQGSGGRLCIRDVHIQNGLLKSLTECLNTENSYVNVYTVGEQPAIPKLAKYQLMEQYSVWQEHYKSNQWDIWAIQDIYQTPELRNLQVAFRPTKIRSILMIPLQYRHQLLAYLSIFRDEVDTETLWAGQFDSDQRQLYPRISFDVWRELRKAQAREWTSLELELAQELAKQFGLAIEQYEQYQQVNAFNANLENLVKERTLQLQQATEQQQALFGVVAKIRDSLNIDTIFQTTKEVCQLLEAEHVAVYRFNPDWSGEFVYDYKILSPGCGDLVNLWTKTIWNDTHLQQTQGGRYRHNESFAVDDIYRMAHSNCHIEILEQFHIKAYVITPIFIGQKLWGLLAAYQHSQPRHWEVSEIAFMSQIAAQIGVGLQQAELLAQTREQAEQLAQTLDHLQQTQIQLIQTEKMSSLGQLVAGIAHEINNPVNFIYANLSHVSEYIDSLLEILALYQQACPNPSSHILKLVKEIDFNFIVEDLPKMLSSMTIGTDRICQIVMSLRNFSRLDEAEMKPVNIHDGIDSTLLILQHRLKEIPDSPKIELIKEYGKLPVVECYPGQLNQVFMNVLSNAIDAINDRVNGWENRENLRAQIPNPQIHIRTEVINYNRIMICIADNGQGIPKNFIGRVFDPFFTTKPVGKGTGLGLSISYQIIVNKHGGVLRCDSQQDVGTKFWIEIPTQQ